jgi:predicted Fe-Mo cluster-binding NifX family protein
VVFTVSDGVIASREKRDKAFHHGHHDHGTEQTVAAVDQGSVQVSHQHGGGLSMLGGGDLHSRMATAISDCQVVVAGGMGSGAYNGLVASGLQPAFVDAETAEQAVADYLAGKTIDYKLCVH